MRSPTLLTRTCGSGSAAVTVVTTACAIDSSCMDSGAPLPSAEHAGEGEQETQRLLHVRVLELSHE